MRESLSTALTMKGFLICVGTHVGIQVGAVQEILSTASALTMKGLLAFVGTHVGCVATRVGA